MAVSKNLEAKAKKISVLVNQKMDRSGWHEAKPWQVIDVIREEGYYLNVKTFRQFLRTLRDENALHLIEGVEYREELKNDEWWFVRKL